MNECFLRAPAAVDSDGFGLNIDPGGRAAKQEIHTAAPNLHLNLLNLTDPSTLSSWKTKPFPLCSGL